MEGENNEIQLNTDLKKLLVSEIDLIRDALSVFLFYVEEPVKVVKQMLHDLEDNNPES